jgi:hypothetical protein
MQSSHTKHVWLIQPPDAPSPVPLLDAAGGATVRFGPAWDLLCLQAFLLARTGHTCLLIDTRLHATIPDALAGLKPPDRRHATALAIIHTSTLQLGGVGAVIAYLHEHHPRMKIALCGPHVAAFPETVDLLHHVDFGFRGDPEIILRSVLDYIDYDQRLRLIPGLIIPRQPVKSPRWSDHLAQFNLPDWKKVHWRPYTAESGLSGLRIEARLSRGHSGQPEDATGPVPEEPLRVWPLAAMAQLLHKCPGHGITEVFFADPPGFWSNQRILEWCRQLKSVTNTQPWSFQLIPRMLAPELIAELHNAGCHRLELVIPSCDPFISAPLGLVMTHHQLADLIQRIESAGIAVALVYWIEGPEEKDGEAGRITSHRKAMRDPAFAVCPFPLHHDSRYAQALKSTGLAPPDMLEWVAWANDPAHQDPPVALWSGKKGLVRAENTIASLCRTFKQNRWRYVKSWRRLFDLSRMISWLETLASNWMIKKHPPPRA